MTDHTQGPSRANERDEFNRLLDRVAYQTPSGLDVDGALRKVRARIEENDLNVRPLPRRHRAARNSAAWRMTTIAAVAAVFVAVVGVYMYRAKSSGFAPAGIRDDPSLLRVTAAGERDSARLADGTMVLIGPSSQLQIGAGFASGRREVTLRGDANFTVMHDAAHPFTVRAGGSLITDLGTVFDVHGDHDGVAVSVSSGTVRLSGESESDGVLLHGGDRALRGATFALVRDAVKRWYGIDVASADSVLEQRHVTASFSRETAGQVLNVLALALGARTEMRGGTAFLHNASPAASRR